MSKVIFFLALLIFLLLPLSAEAGKGGGYGGYKSYGTGSSPRSHSVSPHVRKDGVYIGPSHRTNPDSNKMNNYDTNGNYNPYTGKSGAKNPSGSKGPNGDN